MVSLLLNRVSSVCQRLFVVLARKELQLIKLNHLQVHYLLITNYLLLGTFQSIHDIFH
jgi:hypothetical protein